MQPQFLTLTNIDGKQVFINLDEAHITVIEGLGQGSQITYQFSDRGYLVNVSESPAQVLKAMNDTWGTKAQHKAA